MKFSDIFKSNFLDRVTSVSILDMVIALLLAFCIGLFICYVYKKTYNGVMYSSSFAVTLMVITRNGGGVIHCAFPHRNQRTT